MFPQPISRPGCTGSPGVVGCCRCARGEFACNIACQWEAGTRSLFYQPLETNLMEKNLPDFETWAGIRHTWSLLPICCTCGRNKMLSVFCLFIDNCINFWEVCFLIWHSFGGFFLFCFCFFLIVFIHLFPQKSASIYWKHLNTNKAKELKKKNHNRMKISTPAKIHKDETGCFIIQTGLRNIWIAKLLVSKAPAGVLHQTSVTYICNLFMFVSLPCTSLMTEVFVFSFRSSKRFPGAFLSFSFFHTFFFFLVRGKKKGRVALISQCSAFSLPLLYTVTILCVNFVKGHVLFCGTCSGHTVVSQVLVINVLWKRTNMTVRYFQHLIKEHFTNNTAAVLLLLC